MTFDRVSAANLILDNLIRLRTLLTVVMLNPTDTNIDAYINQAAASETAVQATGITMQLRPNYSAGGVNFSWESYAKYLDDAISSWRKLITELGGPYWIHSRARA